MKSFLNWLGMRFHNHRWEVFEVTPVNVYRRGHINDPEHLTESYKTIVSRCSVCGEFKTKTVRAQP